LGTRNRNDDDTTITFVLDAGDPEYGSYIDYGLPCLISPKLKNRPFVERLNWAAKQTNAAVIGFAADDNRFVTRGWDDFLGMDFAYPYLIVNTNDLLVGDTKGGAVFMRKEAIDALGWFALPTLEHLYVDMVWKRIGIKEPDLYHYDEEVVIEHLHPYAGKAEWDAQYQQYNTYAQDQRDKAAYEAWVANDLQSDVRRLIACR
jgi:hypothetical protein